MWKNQAGTPLRVLPDLIKKGGVYKQCNLQLCVLLT